MGRIEEFAPTKKGVDLKPLLVQKKLKKINKNQIFVCKIILLYKKYFGVDKNFCSFI
jgi:hypothetical protein